MQKLTLLIKVNHINNKEWVEFVDSSVLYLNLVLKSFFHIKLKWQVLEKYRQYAYINYYQKNECYLCWHKLIFLIKIDFLK